MQDGTSKQRRQEREKNLGFAQQFRRQADDASGAERDTLLQKAQSFFQKVRAWNLKILPASLPCMRIITLAAKRTANSSAIDMNTAINPDPSLLSLLGVDRYNSSAKRYCCISVDRWGSPTSYSPERCRDGFSTARTIRNLDSVQSRSSLPDAGDIEAQHCCRREVDFLFSTRFPPCLDFGFCLCGTVSFHPNRRAFA